MHVSFTGELKYWKCHSHCWYDWFGLSYVVDIFCLSLIPRCTPPYNLLLSKWIACVEYISNTPTPTYSWLLFVFKILEVRRKKGSGIISKTCFLLDLLGHSVSFLRLVFPSSFKVIYSPWSSLLLLTQHYSATYCGSCTPIPTHLC